MESSERHIDQQPVFVADHGWRQRAVKAGTAAATALLLAWLVAIVIGALGFGSLPNVPFTGEDSDPRGSNGTPSQRAETPGSQSTSTTNSRTSGSTQSRPGEQQQTPSSSNQTQAAAGTGGSAGGGSTAAASPARSATIPGSVKSNGKGRGAPTTQPAGGRGAPTVNPSGTTPGANAHRSNPNVGGANAGGNGGQY